MTMSVSDKKQRGLILLCWLVYASAYLGRYSYHANINLIMAEYAVNHASAGLVTTFFFFAYGVGQIVNGIFCKYYNKKRVLGGALLVSALLNLTVFFGADFQSMKYLWLANGLVQSVLWPSLVLVLGQNLEEDHLKKAVLVISTTTAAGTLISYGLSALLALSGNYRFSFLAGGVALAAVAAVWMLSYSKLTSTPSREKAPPAAPADLPSQRPARGIYPVIVFLALFAVINNLIKDGLSTWVPSILMENYGLSNSISVSLTLVLPILGIFGTTAAVALNRRIKDFISLSSAFFALSAVTILSVIFLLGTELWMVVLVCFGLVTLLMSGINNVITSMSPLYLRNELNPGALSGILNGFCYAGSTISSYGLGAIADSAGWNGVFSLFLWLSIGASAAGGCYAWFQRKKGRRPSGRQ